MISGNESLAAKRERLIGRTAHCIMPENTRVTNVPVHVASVEEGLQARLVLIVFQSVELQQGNLAVAISIQMPEHPPHLALAANREVTCCTSNHAYFNLRAMIISLLVIAPNSGCGSRVITSGFVMLTSVFRVCHNDGEPVEKPISHSRLRRRRAIESTSRLCRFLSCLVHHLVAQQLLVVEL